MDKEEDEDMIKEEEDEEDRDEEEEEDITEDVNEDGHDKGNNQRIGGFSIAEIMGSAAVLKAESQRQSEVKQFLKLAQGTFPTDHFTDLEPRNPSIDVSELFEIRF